MLEIHVIFPEQKDAYIANTKVCNFFQGMKAFIENDIIVTPVVSNYTGDRKTWEFNICFSDDSITRTINITGGELLLTNGANNIWVFGEVAAYDD